MATRKRLACNQRRRPHGATEFAFDTRFERGVHRQRDQATQDCDGDCRACSFLIVGVAVAFGIRSYLHAGSTEIAVESIAVIPFVNQSKDADAEWISDGLTESIINNLTQLPNLKVIARSSVFRYKGRETIRSSIGKELGVRAVLTGRLMQRGDTMVISAELIDIRDNKQLWGEQYERKLADMLSVQREIAREITNNLRPTLSGVDQSRDGQAVHGESRGVSALSERPFLLEQAHAGGFSERQSPFSNRRSRKIRITLWPIRVWPTLTRCSLLTRSEPPRHLMPKAKEAALKALELDDKLAEAHASFGQIVVYYDYDFATAEREYRHALELNPNYATAHQWLAEHLAAMKRFDEALAEIQRALELDPLSVIMNRIYADILVDARRYDEAIEQYQKNTRSRSKLSDHAFFSRTCLRSKGYVRSSYSSVHDRRQGFGSAGGSHGDSERGLRKVWLESVFASESRPDLEPASRPEVSSFCRSYFLRAAWAKGGGVDVVGKRV